jgi:hypothetical protein
MTRPLPRLLAFALGFLLGASLRRERPCPDCQPPRHRDARYVEPADGVQPADVYLVSLTRADPASGTFSRN